MNIENLIDEMRKNPDVNEILEFNGITSVELNGLIFETDNVSVTSTGRLVMKNFDRLSDEQIFNIKSIDTLKIFRKGEKIFEYKEIRIFKEKNLKF